MGHQQMTTGFLNPIDFFIYKFSIIAHLLNHYTAMFQKFCFILTAALLSALTFTAPAIAQAQGNSQTPEQKLDADARSAALDVCNCMNKFFDELHPKLIDLMNDILEFGEEQAQNNFMVYLASASEEDQARIATDVERMDNVDQELDEFCKEVEERYSEYDDSDEFEVKIISNLSTFPECKLVHSMMILAQEDGDEQ